MTGKMRSVGVSDGNGGFTIRHGFVEKIAFWAFTGAVSFGLWQLRENSLSIERLSSEVRRQSDEFIRKTEYYDATRIRFADVDDIKRLDDRINSVESKIQSSRRTR